MARALAIGALLWPLLLGSAVWARRDGHTPIWTSIVYAAAGRLCHQRPERSFFSGPVQWPVCGRCSGLYLAAPVGAVAGWLTRRRSRPVVGWPFVLLLAGVPTLWTAVAEWMLHWPVSSLWRAGAALPVGAVIALVLVRVTAEGEVH